MIFKEGELKLLWPFYLSTFVMTSLMIFIAYWIVYFKGFMSFTQLSVLMFIFSLMPLLFEIPTGVVADLYGRKLSSLIGYVLFGIILILIAFTKNYYLLIALMCALSISSTFISGALNALVIDNLIYNKREDLKTVFFQKLMIISNLSLLVSAVIGIIAVKFLSLNYIWIISGIGFLFGAIILSFCKEHYEKKKNNIKNMYKEFLMTTKKGLRYTYEHKPLFYLTLFLFGTYAAHGLKSLSFTPEAVKIGLPVNMLSLTLIFSAILGLLFLTISPKITKVLGDKKSLIISILLYSCVTISSFFIYNPYLFLFLFSIQLAIWDSFGFPIYMKLLHEYYVSEMRATLESINKMITATALAIFTLIGGILNDLYGTRNVILLSGILLLLILFLFFKVKEEHHKVDNKKEETKTII